ncbi:hypothetical protein OE88DRAFT_1654700 [Heliocybe sulcata]|uniref:Uncharacterized protein n=1 Tax=Heliocybe sulcata TaxID=5364 RepID=A0A5C3NKN2_9AGAM|nr:hypothetical protein OE88DRAFT_1654700 [Heliocybe sulcata]
MTDYIDRGVQTSPFRPALHATEKSNDEDVSGPISRQFEDKSAHGRIPTQDGTELILSRTERRAYGYQQLTRRRPAHLKDDGGRIVSLPETESEYSAKVILESTTSRVVSMPERQRRRSSVSFSTSVDHSGSIEQSDVSRSEEYSLRRRTRPSTRTSSGTPRTPSPPSSPESVVFISDDAQLPEAFLRRRKSAHGKPSAADDEGWITWTSSPPRPIPALHGPLSLPYARCPSGAEGTIIEDQDNVPRVIWGLDAENGRAGHTRSDSTSSAHPSSRKENHANQKVVPPRLQKIQAQHPKDRTDVPQDFSSNAHMHTSPTATEYYRKPLVMPADQLRSPNKVRNADTLGSVRSASIQPPRIDDGQLSSLLRSNAALSRNGRQLHPLDLDELPLGWHSMLADRDLNAPGAAANGTPTEDLMHYLKATAPAFVPSRSLASLYGPGAVIEPRNVEQPQHSSHRRLPTIDLTQPQYLQLALGRQTLLPTPPNSSSPLWCSDFSPYQESLLSPPGLAASLLPGLSNNVPVQLRNAGMNEQLRRALYERLGAGSTLSADSALPLVSGAHIHTSGNAESLATSQRTLSAVQEYLNNQNHQAAGLSPPWAASSPARLRVPPNTPMQNLVAARRQEAGHGRPQAASTIPLPPSPRSPETRTHVHGNVRSLSNQQPRSIPLAKLIQRRLSAVPETEEEATFIREPSPSPSPTRAHLEHRSPRTVKPEVPQQTYSAASQPQRKGPMSVPVDKEQERGRQSESSASRTTSRQRGSKGEVVRATAKVAVEAHAASEDVKASKSSGKSEGSKNAPAKRRAYRKKNRTASIDSIATVASVPASSSQE